MKKKIILVLLSAFVITSLVACSDNKPNEDANKVNDNKTQEVIKKDDKQTTTDKKQDTTTKEQGDKENKKDVSNQSTNVKDNDKTSNNGSTSTQTNNSSSNNSKPSPKPDPKPTPKLLSLRVWSLCSSTREATRVRGPRTAMKSGPRLPQLQKALAQKRRPNIAINQSVHTS